jgi:hypothetical protein
MVLTSAELKRDRLSCRSLGSSSGSTWAIPVRQRPPTRIRMRGFASMLRT